MSISKDSPFSSDSSAKFTKKQVYMILRNFVYPKCLKEPDDIRMDDNLDTDLGYAGNSKLLLAPKTNQAFGLQPPHHFTGPEVKKLTLVSDHYAATCAKLKAAGRL